MLLNETLPDTQKLLPYWLALLHVPRCGPACCRKLLTAFGDITQIFKAKATDLAALGLVDEVRQGLLSPEWESVEHAIKWLQADSQRHILTWYDNQYPPQLKEIAASPPLLFIHGKPEVLWQSQLAVVGSRNPSPGGMELTEAWVEELVHSGLVITSGLALGIDAVAHRSALTYGGKTVAIMGTGLEQIYPVRHQKLAEAIITQGGALVSEFPLTTPPKAENFPRRNRVVSGLCLGTLVIEAGLRSGSLITARLAVEQGREVFAVPGSVHNPLAKGCHWLIQQGAKLVETVADVLEELPLVRTFSGQTPQKPALPITTMALDEAYAKLLECIPHEPTPCDLLVARSGKTVAELSVMLLQLELQGWIVSMYGGYMRVK
jgi:DNA processing protein